MSTYSTLGFAALGQTVAEVDYAGEAFARIPGATPGDPRPDLPRDRVSVFSGTDLTGQRTEIRPTGACRGPRPTDGSCEHRHGPFKSQPGSIYVPPGFWVDVFRADQFSKRQHSPQQEMIGPAIWNHAFQVTWIQIVDERTPELIAKQQQVAQDRLGLQDLLYQQEVQRIKAEAAEKLRLSQDATIQQLSIVQQQSSTADALEMQVADAQRQALANQAAAEQAVVEQARSEIAQTGAAQRAAAGNTIFGIPIAGAAAGAGAIVLLLIWAARR